MLVDEEEEEKEEQGREGKGRKIRKMWYVSMIERKICCFDERLA